MTAILIAVLLVLTMSGFASGETTIVITQSGAPLKIARYATSFRSDQITHSTSVVNLTDKPIVAVQIGFATFDAFNDFMGAFTGWSIENLPPGKEEKRGWSQKPYAAFSFERYGTGVAYVKAVRFEDGTIWKADMNEVLNDLRKFAKELTREDLQEKKK
jgi:hypothetical protein